MILKKIFDIYVETLSLNYDKNEAIAITNVAFEKILNKNKTAIYLEENEAVNNETAVMLNEALVQLKNNIPLQYVLGEAWFYNLLFFVNNTVLIPRPETEELVNEVIQYLKTSPPKKIIDIGTGSGCIAISVKKNSPLSKCTAIDVSEAALVVAKKNANFHQCEIDFKEINFLEEKNYNELGVYDIIISNPPYIPYNEKNSLHKNVTANEPTVALFVPNDEPLLFYKKIVVFAENHLAQKGKIFLEVHEDFARETAALFNTNKYTVNIKKDMQGKHRMLIIDRCL